MIQTRLKELIAARSRQQRRRITYKDIHEATGVSTNTLFKLANDKAAMVGFSVIDRLCEFLECQPGDLLIRVTDESE